MHIDNKNKIILVLSEGPTQGLDNTTITAETKYPINFTESGERFVLSLHYNTSNIFLFVNATKIYQFKEKNLEIKPYILCLGNVSRYFTINNKKKTGLIGVVKVFFGDFNVIDTSDILGIHRYLIKET